MDAINSNTINGPVNIVRMEGYVHGIKKVIYVFFDIHMGIGEQTKCPDFTSLDLYQYFAMNLANTKNTIDFMFEGRLSEVDIQKTLYKKIYISEVTNFFNTKFNENIVKKKKGEKVNVRFHYVDIRDDYMDTVYTSVHHVSGATRNMEGDPNFFNDDTIFRLEMCLDELTTDLDGWHNLIFGDMTDEYLPDTKKFMKKIRYEYKDPKVLEGLGGIFNYTKKLYDESYGYIEQIREYVKKNNNINKINSNMELNYSKFGDKYEWGYNYFEYADFTLELNKMSGKLHMSTLQLFSNLMDIYFLRRFLDKDYIDHAIIYTGAAHSICYVQHLLTKYDFKITHTSYSMESNMDKLNNHLKKFGDPASRQEYQKGLYAPNLLQCSDISKFPKNFN